MKNLGLVLISLMVALGLVEAGSRLILPLQYGHTFVSLNGEPINPIKSDLELKPGITFRQVTQEFDKIITHTPGGFRGPMSPSEPEIIFIGDSFTYGVGLGDGETIPYLYCTALGLACANLGRGGTATIRQLDILEHYLHKTGWRPKEVKLMMLVMTSSLMAGNDLNGNVEEWQDQNQSRQSSEKAEENERLGPWQDIVSQRKAILRYSNLARAIFYFYGPAVRAKLSPKSAAKELEKALKITQQQLKRLDRLSKDLGFSYSVYIIHPVRDLINNTYEQTNRSILDMVPNKVVIDTAPALLNSGSIDSYFYNMDGHLNPVGAKTVADYMASLPR